MQALSKKELMGFENEYEMVCAAQYGNSKAWMGLWNHYRGLMMSRLIAVQGLTREEIESEAVEVFAIKIHNFDRNKVNNREKFSIFTWVYCAAISRTNKMIRQSKKDVHLYLKNVNASGINKGDDDDGTEVGEYMIGVDEGIYTRYSPERIVFEKEHEDDTARVREFYARLSDFDKDILELRRKGLTLAQTAGQLRCSVSTVKHHIKMAKDVAFDVFGLRTAA